jgi:hypothetical protein
MIHQHPVVEPALPGRALYRVLYLAAAVLLGTWRIAGAHTLTGADPLPDDLREALDRIGGELRDVSASLGEIGGQKLLTPAMKASLSVRKQNIVLPGNTCIWVTRTPSASTVP